MIISEDELNQIIADQESQSELDTVKSVTYWQEQVLGDLDHVSGIRLPWAAMEGRFELRPGELSVWAGESGAGKSMILSQAMASMLSAGERVLIASFEMRPAETIRRMIRQCAGRANPTDAWRQRWFEWADEKLYLYDKLDTVDAERIVRATRACATHLGIRHIVIDSLTKCRVPTDGPGALSAQTAFVDSLQYTAKHLDIHIHLVAHMRKPEGSRRMEPSKHDIRGAGQITDLADNVLLLTRNEAKENAQIKQSGGAELSEKEMALLDSPDSFLRIDKQRYNGDQRNYALWYDRDSLRFASTEGHRSRWEEPW